MYGCRLGHKLLMSERSVLLAFKSKDKHWFIEPKEAQTLWLVCSPSCKKFQVSIWQIFGFRLLKSSLLHSRKHAI